MIAHDVGEAMYALASRLWPINRSLTGDGVRATLRVLKELLPGIVFHEVPSGTPVFDWKVPNEWNVREAWIEDPYGNRVVDFAENNLHLVGYSTPVDTVISLEELQNHLHSLPDQSTAIPYVTSYYSERWGFCLCHQDRVKLKPGNYHVHINASLEPGFLTYGELVIPGDTAEEIFLSTYICHPSMANNELSGPCVTAYLAKWLNDLPKRRYSYRIVFIPETIGSLTYLSRNLRHLKKYVIAGFNVTCVGDERGFSYLPSRAGDTFSDRAALHALRHLAGNFSRYSYLDRGSDERQYCSPGVDLPIATIMRSKYKTYPEYHTSLDDLTLVSASGLAGGYMALRGAIETLELNCIPRVTVLGEPQLSPRGLYPILSTASSYEPARAMMDLIAYSDGNHCLLDIAEIIGVPVWDLRPICDNLSLHGLMVISEVEH